MTEDRRPGPPGITPRNPPKALSRRERAVVWALAALALLFGTAAFLEVQGEWAIVGQMMVIVLVAGWIVALAVTGYLVRWVRPAWARLLLLVAGPYVTVIILRSSMGL